MKLASLLAAVLAALVLTACGGGDPEPEESDVQCYSNGVKQPRSVCDGPVM